MEHLWPFFGLRVVTPDVELRYIDDELAPILAARTAEPIHDPTVMPFGVPWTDVPAGERPRNTLQHVWRERAELSPASWAVPMAVLVAGEVVGVQAVTARDFAVTRTVSTGSWLLQAVQGRGIGTAMRRAILHLAFDGFGAVEATTCAYEDNHPSLGVTRKVGYEPNGDGVAVRRGESVRQRHFRLTVDRWREVAGDLSGFALHGVEPCLPLLLGAG